jgi:hypothetical protein
VVVLDFSRARKVCRDRFGSKAQTGEHTAYREQLSRARARWVLADTPTRRYVLFGLACVPEDSEEVAGSTGGDEQMPDEMAITELFGQVKSDPAGVSESAGG